MMEHIRDAGPSRNECQVGDPETIRRGRRALTIDKIGANSGRFSLTTADSLRADLNEYDMYSPTGGEW